MNISYFDQELSCIGDVFSRSSKIMTRNTQWLVVAGDWTLRLQLNSVLIVILFVSGHISVGIFLTNWGLLQMNTLLDVIAVQGNSSLPLFRKTEEGEVVKICCCSFGQNIGNRLNIIFSKSACSPARGPGFGRSSNIRGYKIIQMYFSLAEGFGNQGDHRKIRESCLLQSGNLSAVLRILKEKPARHFTQQSLSISVHVQHCLSSEGEFICSTKSTEGRAGEKLQEGFSAILPFSDSSTSTC